MCRNDGTYCRYNTLTTELKICSFLPADMTKGQKMPHNSYYKSRVVVFSRNVADGSAAFSLSTCPTHHVGPAASVAEFFNTVTNTIYILGTPHLAFMFADYTDSFGHGN